MRVLVTGSRKWRDYETVRNALARYPTGITVVHGAATGADHIAHSAAHALGHTPEPHFPRYDCYPSDEAPKVRNALMVSLGADVCLAFPTPGSVGTWHCIRLAKDVDIPVEVIPLGGGSA